MNTLGLWQIVGSGPARLEPGGVPTERDLEDWIESDPALLERGLVIVGRQVRLEGGPLDLLALDPQGRWVLIEIKRERLRREVIAQAIDYASCLHRVDPALLQEQCNAYLRSRSRSETLEALLEQRGRSLESEAEGRDLVIYLVGTGYDTGLERMVGYLAETAQLAVRMVTFSPFRDEQGRMLLAREIHEGTEEPLGTSARPSRPAPTLDALLALAEQNGVGSVARTLCETARDLGLYARPYVRSIMFAPPENHTRCLFVVWVDGRQKQPGFARAYMATEAFEQFYGIDQASLEAAVGSIGYILLDQAGAEHVSAGLRTLLPAKEA